MMTNEETQPITSVFVREGLSGDYLVGCIRGQAIGDLLRALKEDELRALITTIQNELKERAIRATHLDEAPDESLPEWVFSYLRQGEKAYYVKTSQGLIVLCLSDDPSRDGRNLWTLWR
jgi:hypothetical protein